MLIEASILLCIVSVLFKVFKPKKRNLFYGYRTRLSKLSQYNWDEAQRYSSTVFIVVSIILFVLGVIFNFTKTPYELGITVISVLVAVGIIPILTEQHLKRIRKC